MIRILSLIALAILFARPVAADETLSGLYFGIDDAIGAQIEIEPDSNGYTGTFYDAFGKSQRFEADRIEDSAEAVLDMDGRTVLIRIAPLPFGAEVALVPFDAQGRLEVGASRVLTFLREGVSLPERPDGFVDAPRRPGDRIAGNSFLVSYEFWEPVGVRNGYLALPQRFRTLMRMFPAVQLDVIWKLCLAPEADRALAVALRGQGVACDDVLSVIAATQRSGDFDDYKEEVSAERTALRTNVRCADGYVESKALCDAAARELSQKAIDLRTAGSVLARYR